MTPTNPTPEQERSVLADPWVLGFLLLWVGCVAAFLVTANGAWVAAGLGWQAATLLITKLRHPR